MKIFYLALLIGFCTAKLAAQNMGVGTTNPTQKLHVNGGIRIGNTSVADTGAIRWNELTRDFEGYTGERWISLTSGRSGWGYNDQFSSESGGIFAAHASDTAFGETISLSGDRLAIGYPRDENGIYGHSGAVRIVKINTNSSWGHNNVIYSPNIANFNQFGSSVSVSGNELVVGEPGALMDGNTQQGKAYVYKLNDLNQAGAPFALLQTAGDPFDRFGRTVAISYDFIAVAASDKNIAGFVKQGRVYTFRRLYILGEPTDGFIAESNFSAPESMSNMKFGSAISLHPGVMAISAPGTTVGGDAGAGKVYIYRRINNAWQYEGAVTSPNPLPNDNFGKSISINSTGDTMVVGMPGYSGSGNAFIYVKIGASWYFNSALPAPSSGLSESFGSSVDFKPGRILVGSPYTKVGINNHQGKATLFSRSGNSWVKEAQFTPLQGESSLLFGSIVQLGNNMVVASAPGYSNYSNRVDLGRVYWFFK